MLSSVALLQFWVCVCCVETVPHLRFDGTEDADAYSSSEQVTCFEYASQLLPREDPDAAKCLEEVLLEDGLEIKLG